ncbi:AzlC family ABC transporter permease [Pseudomonas sp. 148P]|uniref:AzlC family ABC transporter permease n=1 Tax=Pseudomonas ulcerans TaxID=3115852 RepID=A0ABU7HKT9_9PSED|nr:MULTISPECIES: AzlC family ABC transporter permease [unclassified Pseudomonas]MEE1920959.1 AzlC family ABC transporter permease [Pseudomonas sp. 147P]MEE1932140.1 AzlC family ABC transporter permease [Pseudomonas sp. 148P]
MPFSSGRAAFAQGVRALLPLTPGVIPFGLVTGVMAIKMGMTPTMAIGMTLLFYSGSAQMVALQLIHSGVLPVAIVVTALIINLRFIMYSASLAPHLHQRPRRWTWPMSYMLSDQSYALCALRMSSGELGRFAPQYYAGTAVTMWLAWNLSVLAGVFLGGSIPESWSLGFAIPLSFLALLVPGIRNLPALVAAIVGGGIAVAAVDLPYNLGLVTASIGGVIAGVTAEGLRRKPSEPTYQAEGESQ